MPINYDVEYSKLRMKYGKALQKIEQLEALLRHAAEGTWWDGNEPFTIQRLESWIVAALVERNE